MLRCVQGQAESLPFLAKLLPILANLGLGPILRSGQSGEASARRCARDRVVRSSYLAWCRLRYSVIVRPVSRLKARAAAEGRR